MLEVILSGGLGGEVSRESRGVWGPLDPPAFARLPGLRIYPVRAGCLALRFTRLPGSFCPVFARSLASGQFIDVPIRTMFDFVRTTYGDWPFVQESIITRNRALTKRNG